MSDPKNPNQINIELSEEVAQGIYSNLAIITHSASEFVIDFVRIMPGIPKAQVKSRIVLTLACHEAGDALEDNIAKYEAVHGKIKDVKGSAPALPLTFEADGTGLRKVINIYKDSDD